MKISTEGALPLITRLSIDSVSIGLNGTVVRCSDVANPMTSASTTIQIIDTSQSELPNPIILKRLHQLIITSLDFQYVPKLRITEEHYGADNVTITVEWTQVYDVTYTANVSPMVPLMPIESTSRRLTISYGEEYNFSVTAATPCRPNASNFTTISYGEV
jgi:hypothetical protein